MAIKLGRITYEDKLDYKVEGEDDRYKISSKDMNEIKSVFNGSAAAAEQALTTSEETNETINDNIEKGNFIPKLKIGTITTIDPSAKAEVTITGTPQEPVFNMKLPKGEQGTQGIQGIQGKTGPTGPQGPSGPTQFLVDTTVQNKVTAKTTRNANATKVKVQLQDANGRALYIETSADKVYIVGSDDSQITQQDLNNKLGQLINSIAFYSASPVNILTDLKKYISTIE